jgi:hypothetical protein
MIDIITSLTTGALFTDLANDSDWHGYLRATTEVQPALVMIGSVPSVNKFIQILFIGKRLFPTAEDEIVIGKMIGFASILSLRIISFRLWKDLLKWGHRT